MFNYIFVSIYLAIEIILNCMKQWSDKKIALDSKTTGLNNHLFETGHKRIKSNVLSRQEVNNISKYLPPKPQYQQRNCFTRLSYNPSPSRISLLSKNSGMGFTELVNSQNRINTMQNYRKSMNQIRVKMAGIPLLPSDYNSDIK